MGVSSMILGDNSECPEYKDKWAGPSLSAMAPLWWRTMRKEIEIQL